MLSRQADPIEWLQQELQVEFPQDGEILSISLEGPSAEREDLVHLVDAIAKAYRDEVISSERHNKLATRDLLARNLDNLNDEVKSDMTEYFDIARELDQGLLAGNNVVQDIESKRLDRIENEIVRLESDLAVAPPENEAKLKAIEKRVRDLRDQQLALETSIKNRAQKSPDLEMRRKSLDERQRIATDMSYALSKLDIDASTPDRIRPLQPAVISPRSEPVRSVTSNKRVAGSLPTQQPN